MPHGSLGRILGVRAALGPGSVHRAANICPLNPAQQNWKCMSMHSNIYLGVKDRCNLNETLLCHCLALQKCDLMWHHRAKLELTASASKPGCWSHSVTGFLKCFFKCTSIMMCPGFIHSWCYSCSRVWSDWEIERTKGEKQIKREIPFCALSDLSVQGSVHRANQHCLRHQPAAWKVGKYTWNVCRNAGTLFHWNLNQLYGDGRFMMENLCV